MKVRILIVLLGGLMLVDGSHADETLYKRENEVIYGRKHGLAMTLDVFQPLAKRNGRGIVFAISGGSVSYTHLTLPTIYSV